MVFGVQKANSTKGYIALNIYPIPGCCGLFLTWGIAIYFGLRVIFMQALPNIWMVPIMDKEIKTICHSCAIRAHRNWFYNLNFYATVELHFAPNSKIKEFSTIW